MLNHEPRGCSHGASFSYYLYSANRLKHPIVRGALVKLWRERRRTLAPVDAWRAIVEDDDVRRSYQSRRGLGSFLLPDPVRHAARPDARAHDLLHVPVRDRAGVADPHLPVGSAAHARGGLSAI